MTAPFYSVLARPGVLEKVHVGMPVYCSLEHATLVSREKLISEKGLDNEDSAHEFSDDEEEARFKTGLEKGEIK